MFLTTLALAAALAATPPKAQPAPDTGDEMRVPTAPPTQPMNLNRGQDESARCRAMVSQVMFDAGKPAAIGPIDRQTWQPGAYPAAGYYHTLNKRVAGCTVPVPVKRQASTIPAPTPAK